ncbi:putative multidrug ABC transporter permease YbhR [Pseudoclavibacter triregionum]|nr:putative multidrug ABC transporter permease YbhR [Pseudoclavibacter triregionum]
MTILANGLRRVGYELRGYFRAADQVVFTFLFPVLMLLLFGSIFGSQDVTLADGSSVSGATLMLPGFLAMAPWLSGIQGLAVDIAVEKHEGGLKRLGATPLHPLSYFIGKFGQVLVTTAIQIALLLAVAQLAFGAGLPAAGSQGWSAFAWVTLLGLACCSALGIAVSALPRSGRAAAAVVIPLVLIPQFISGVYLTWDSLPEWLQNLASVLPLKWIAQGYRASWLPDSFSAMEQGGAWNLPMVAIVIAAWLVIGVVLARLTFRWTRGRA